MLNMIPPVKDRNYYRMLDNEELLYAVRYAQSDRTNWEEVSIVLAERLKKSINEQNHHYVQLETRDY